MVVLAQRVLSVGNLSYWVLVILEGLTLSIYSHWHSLNQKPFLFFILKKNHIQPKEEEVTLPCGKKLNVI